MKKVILLAGPTASGKSDIAIRIAKKINGEIINADSMQVYKEIKILSARPQDYKKIKHHLFGFVSVKKTFSTGQWLKEVNKKVNGILKKNKTPIIVGGTGLYFKSLIDGISKVPKISKVKRSQIVKLYENIGPEKFYKKLIKLDHLSKNKINYNDKQRMIRFYEVKYFTGKSIFEWQKSKKANLSGVKFIKIFLNMPRDWLLENIEKRLKKMFRAGVMKEVIKFKKLKVKKDLSSNYILGLKELILLSDQKIGKKEALERTIIRTRQYVKRQMTWFRGQMKDWEAFEETNRLNLEKKILKLIRTA
jgi:tRNA dimethylallyltransferase